MVWSKWNLASRQYDLYKSGSYQGTHVQNPPPTPLLGNSSLGLTPDQFAWSMPPGAVKVGTSPTAQGRICSSGVGFGIPKWLVYGVVAYVVWRAIQ